jgi:hypothetical protein
VPAGEVDARTTITIDVELSRLPVIVEKHANGERQMHVEGSVYIHATHFDVQRKGCHERARTNCRNRRRRVCRILRCYREEPLRGDVVITLLAYPEAAFLGTTEGPWVRRKVSPWDPPQIQFAGFAGFTEFA